ncbi:HAD family hydrolase [uncultured Tateyamaria sp.]|uniref:HAD family hydrolase n=1 Tax=uncultured Tateyamaria sp. TaxID=455651 RepID=UPI002614AF8E|nr:HAD family hydrolase [uncultured Tateyamaria sp.]
MMEQVIVWDFDGVLNGNIVDGRFVWADALFDDWGVRLDALQSHLFRPERMRSIMRGERDLRDALSEWIAGLEQEVDVDAFLAYWFAKDARPDPAVLPHLERLAFRHVIGTNNEARRAAYIETEMGFADRVERVFASGRMGCAKPEDAYFAQIEDWTGAPAASHVLVDDSKRNADAAQARGWRAYHFADNTRAGLGPFLDRLTWSAQTPLVAPVK